MLKRRSRYHKSWTSGTGNTRYGRRTRRPSCCSLRHPTNKPQIRNARLQQENTTMRDPWRFFGAISWYSLGPITTLHGLTAARNLVDRLVNQTLAIIQTLFQNNSVFRDDFANHWYAWKCSVTKNTGFCDVTPCGSCKNRRFGAPYRLHHHCEKNMRTRNVSTYWSTLWRIASCWIL
jgi:hypothetical protein